MAEAREIQEMYRTTKNLVQNDTQEIINFVTWLHKAKGEAGYLLDMELPIVERTLIKDIISGKLNGNVFYIYRNDQEIYLKIKDMVDENSCVIDMKLGKEPFVNDTVAVITGYPEHPNKLYLKFHAKSQTVMLCVCDLEEEDSSNQSSVVKNRQIADYLWENIQDSHTDGIAYPFTSDSWKII